MPSFRVDPIPQSYLDWIRERGHDGHGNPVQPVEDLVGGKPLRCCLRDSYAGERVALVSYAPLTHGGPYWEVGPVFIHAEMCRGYPTPGQYPPAFRDRAQVLRAYAPDQTIVGGRVVQAGEDQPTAVEELFSRGGTAFLHARNPVHGCFMFEVRPESP